jgi:uncharacterized protein
MIKWAIDGLQNVVAGLMTARDKRSYNQYSSVTPMMQAELEAIYRTSWLAKRIINAVAEDMTREWMSVTIPEMDDLDFCKLEKPWKLKKVVRDAIRDARLYGGSAIIIGIRGLTLDQELPSSIKPGSLQYLLELDKWRLSGMGEIEDNIESPNFDYPKFYALSGNAQKIHPSRVIRFDGQPLPYQAWVQNNRWGDSELQHVIDSVKDYDSVRNIIGTMLFEANVDVVSSPGMGEMLSMKDGEQKLIKRFQTSQLMKSVNRTLLLDEGETYEKKSNSFTNLSDIWLRFIDDVAGAADIPVTRLFGQSPKGLNSTGDGELTNYYDMISSKQESGIKHQTEQLTRLILLNAGIEDDFELEFNPLWQMSDKDLVTITKTQSDQDKTYYDMGVLTPVQISQELLRKKTYQSITPDSIQLLDELENPITQSGEDDATST